MAARAQEFNFDGLVGPTHNYAGLPVGNIASAQHSNLTSNPKAAALQGLAKMKQLYDLGVPQAVLPPHTRPDINFLRNIGFPGTTEKVLSEAYKLAPRLFAASYSASSMWTANAATVTPSTDSSDGKLHLIPANLATNIHRAIESEASYNILKQVFANPDLFTVHRPLFNNATLGDEGAANHTRFCNDYHEPGVGLFVYGHEHFNKQSIRPVKYPSRQTLEASQAIARQHGLNLSKTLFMQQLPEAIDHGVFHNDVCSVGNKKLFLCYEHSFVDQNKKLNQLKTICANHNIDLTLCEIKSKDLPYSDLVSSYLFNSQLVVVHNQDVLITPVESQQNNYAHDVINNTLLQNNIIDKVIYVDCRQSMFNGGGPACLRLRVVLTGAQVQSIQNNCNVIFNEKLYADLVACVNKYYRDRLAISDLLDPQLYKETTMITQELSKILRITIPDNGLN